MTSHSSASNIKTDDEDVANAAEKKLEPLDVGAPLSKPGPLTAHERRDIRHTLDHLFVTGSHYRHEHWRRRQFHELGDKAIAVAPPRKRKWTRGRVNDNEEDDDNENDDEGSCSGFTEEEMKELSAAMEAADDPKNNQYTTLDEELGANNVQTKRPRLPEVHAEDWLVYGVRTIDSLYLDIVEAWPVKNAPSGKRQPMSTSDQRWAEFHGDSVDTVALYNQQLSLKSRVAESPAAAAEREKLWSGQMIVRPNKPPQEEPQHQVQDATRKLVLRCWERAVHAASQTITHVPSDTSNHPLQPPQTSVSEEATVYSREQAEKKCKALAIQLLPPANEDAEQPTLECASCGISVFESLDKLQDHFYGTNATGNRLATRGCCWRLVEQAELKLIRTILETEAKIHIQKLMERVLWDTLPPPKDRPGGDDAPLPRASECLYKWDHVLKVLNGIAKSSRKIQPWSNDEPSVYDTVNLAPGQQPVTLNPQLISVVTNRIIQRYGRLPK